jgi:hypothetical protein
MNDGSRTDVENHPFMKILTVVILSLTFVRKPLNVGRQPLSLPTTDTCQLYQCNKCKHVLTNAAVVT